MLPKQCNHLGNNVHKKPATETSVLSGNFYDKYGSRNPIERLLMRCFLKTILDLLAVSDATNIHEVGCGEGHLSRIIAREGFDIRGSDFSGQIVEKAKALSAETGILVPFKVASIYDLDPKEDSAELVLCSEVLEHLEKPEKALSGLAQVANPYLLVSVPREPIWRILNLYRLKYVSKLGNTPGHMQHWSPRGFSSLLRAHFEIVELRLPVPWIVGLCRVSGNR